MVEPFDIGVAVFFLPAGLWFGYRAVTAATLYRALSGVETASPAGAVDGEPVAVEGAVAVDEAADAADRTDDAADRTDDATDSADGRVGSPIAAYVWRARFPKSGSNAIDLADREVEQAKATFASGMEAVTSSSPTAVASSASIRTGSAPRTTRRSCRR